MSEEHEKAHYYCDICGFEVPPEDIDRFYLSGLNVCYDCYVESKSNEFQDMGWEDEMADS